MQPQPPAKAFYHVREQEALPLLAPVEAELATIETRLQHYAERVRMSDDVRATIGRARDAVARARTEVGGIVESSRAKRG